MTQEASRLHRAPKVPCPAGPNLPDHPRIGLPNRREQAAAGRRQYADLPELARVIQRTRLQTVNPEPISSPPLMLAHQARAPR